MLVPKTNAHHRISPAVILNMGAKRPCEARRAIASQTRSDLAALYVRATPRSFLAFVHLERIICPRKAIGNLSEISSPQAARLFAARHHSVAFLDCKKLRVLRALRMTDRGGVRWGRLLRWERTPALRVCAPFFHKTNIGDFSGSRWSLTAIGRFYRQRTDYANPCPKL